MKKLVQLLALVGTVIAICLIATLAFAGTDKTTGEVCQGSTCSTGTTTTPAIGDITANGGTGGSANATSSALGVGIGGSAVANGGVANSNSVGIGGGANVTNNNKVKNANKNSNKNTNVNNNRNNNSNRNTNKNSVSNSSSNVQGQSQSTQVNNGQTIAPTQTTTITTEAPRLAAPTVAAQEVPILQGGKIGDVTEAMPDFFGIAKLAKGEQIVRVIKVLNGGWFTKIRLEDVPSAIIENVPTDAKVRYSVWAKDGVTSVTTGGGISAAQSVGASAATGSVLPGWASSISNPAFVIFIYEVK